jgi:photosystem II stability/assembly factor-like uncharacterized protein
VLGTLRLQSVACSDSNTCTAVGDGWIGPNPADIILRTTDGWATWTQQSGGSRGFWGVSCADVNTCTAVGTSILHTTDGGATWTQSIGVANAVSCPNANTCTAVLGAGTTPRGVILRSTDGGATWTEQRSNASPPLFGVSCSDANTCTIVGAYGAILHTNTGGEPIRAGTILD